MTAHLVFHNCAELAYQQVTERMSETSSTSFSSCSTAYSSCASGSYASFETAPPPPESFPKLHCFPAKTVAEELTLLDASLLRMIKPSELEDGVWMKKDKVGWGWACWQL